ncbi:efflux RND transporter periplasmic adaptor subunit [Cognatiluteimonas profundi]|uniref:efflux RND transporter periplasmic adaptor subunit n=1 Tax=Cognatiluteimonas profundi TaxID=2594501 RepID=UPI00131EC9BF|nr:efflux RND transporter periplasmic adaptor subunit [Lysobacter profundi]
MTIRLLSVLLTAAVLVGCGGKDTDGSTASTVPSDPAAEPASEPAGDSAQPKGDFAVTAAQMQALGIKLQRLDSPTEIRGLTYPARVVVPPQQEQILSAPVAGLVDRILVAEHQTVRRGDPLLRLNSPEFGELQLALMQAANSARLTGQTLARERNLFNEGVIPQRRVFEAELAANDSQARLRQSQAALRLAGLDQGSISRIAGGGALMDGLLLRAQEAGTVLALDVKPGQRVSGADPLLRVANLSELWLDIQLPADRANAWSKDQTIAIVGSKLTATPMSVSALVSESQTVTLRARVDAGETQELNPGQFVQAQVPFADSAGAWAVPIASVVRQDGDAYVFVRTPSGFSAKPVKVVASAAQSVSVDGAFKPGDEIAVSNVIALKAAWLGESGGE